MGKINRIDNISKSRTIIYKLFVQNKIQTIENIQRITDYQLSTVRKLLKSLEKDKVIIKISKDIWELSII